ncbi:MAG: TlpA disulfide reductase family protein, partial [Bacteroidota bacterium]
SNLSGHISNVGVDGLEEPVATFMATSENQKQKEKISKMYEKASKLAKGQLAPNFSYPDIEGSNISLETLKGRYIYIDVWATWCGPCLKELPHLEALQEQYKGNRNIAFTSISIDKNKKAWRKMVTEKKMKGIQLISDKDWDSQICKDYIIRGIPRFILIDREGKIVDANAPRPSSDELKDLLANLLSEDRSAK